MTNQFTVLDQAQSTFVDLAIKFGPKLVVALLILTAGFYVGRWIGAVFARWLSKLNLDPPVRTLLVRIVRVAVLAVFMIMALQNLGIDLLPLIAGLGVAGAGVALAMQGVLSNLAAGLTIIFTRPFRVGDYVSVVGVEGEVEEIDLFSTRLSHTDRSIVVVPNRKIVGEILHNYGRILQLDISIAITRTEDIEPTLAVIDKVLNDNPRILKDPAPVVGVKSLGDTSIGICVNPWVSGDDYVAAGGEVKLAIVEQIHAAGVVYPLVERQIRLVNA